MVAVVEASKELRKASGKGGGMYNESSGKCCDICTHVSSGRLW